MTTCQNNAQKNAQPKSTSNLHFGLLAAAVGLLAVSSACVIDDPLPPGQGDCVPTETFFEDQVWNNFMSERCIGCHNAQGAANMTDLVLQSSGQPNYLKNNFDTVADVAALERDGISIILLKPSAQVDHGGGTVIEKDGPQYLALQEFIERLDNPVQCEVEENTEFFNDVEMLDEERTLRKASLALVGRLPTDDEAAQVQDGDDEDMNAVLDNMMQEEAFLSRVSEMYNDMFLTDRYLGGNNATNLLDDEDYPDRRYYDDLEETDPAYDSARAFANDSVARAPLRLVRHIVENERPFTEILTADYMMVNPFSAQVYGISNVDFTDPLDDADWKEAQLSNVPHAGVLTDPMWLNRFPTTETNRNRHRSRMVYSFFMATDIMRLAERPVDPGSIIEHNATMNNPQCTVCHANIDPIAGTFMNWDPQGRFRPRENGWYEGMRPPGVSEETTLPGTQYGSALQWMASQIANDPLFALSTVHNVYTGLTGQAPITPPNSSYEGDAFDARDTAFKAQDADFQRIAQAFIDGGYNFKQVVREVVMSSWFRADEGRSAAGARTLELADVGTARFLTPELLDRKIEAVLGVPWARSYDDSRYLLTENEYLIFYGGIDSDDVTTRITEPNGLMASVTNRISNEMSCSSVPRDFSLLPQERTLFPNVMRTFEPLSDSGFEVPGAIAAIKETIASLHWRVLGERLSVDDPEVERTYQLFFETWQEGKTKVASEEVGNSVDYGCRATTFLNSDEPLPEERQVSRDDNYVVRSWMAVMSYLLRDYRFLHE